MVGTDFLYDGIRLTDFNLMMVDPEEEQAFPSRGIDKSDITTLRSKPNYYAVKYDDVLVLDFLIMKDACIYESQSFAQFTSEDVHDIRSWLESKKVPDLLVVTDEDSDIPEVSYFGVFTDIQPYLIGSICYGLKLQFTCNAPYGFSDLQINRIVVDGSGDVIPVNYVNVSAERHEYLYPTFNIVSSSAFVGESVTITNADDGGRSMTLTLPSGKTKVVIDCEKKIATDESGRMLDLSELGISFPSDSDYNPISASTFSVNWPRFVQGNNNLTVQASSGNTIRDIAITARFIVKTGGI